MAAKSACSDSPSPAWDSPERTPYAEAAPTTDAASVRAKEPKISALRRSGRWRPAHHHNSNACTPLAMLTAALMPT